MFFDQKIRAVKKNMSLRQMQILKNVWLRVSNRLHLLLSRLMKAVVCRPAIY